MEPLYSSHTWGTNFGCYIGVAFIEGLFCTQTVHLGPGCLAVIHAEVALIYSGMAKSRLAVDGQLVSRLLSWNTN